jgi:hypothetical protein
VRETKTSHSRTLPSKPTATEVSDGARWRLDARKSDVSGDLTAVPGEPLVWRLRSKDRAREMAPGPGLGVCKGVRALECELLGAWCVGAARRSGITDGDGVRDEQKKGAYEVILFDSE